MFYFALDLVIFGASQLNALLQRAGSRDERKAADWFGGCVSPTALSGNGGTEHGGGLEGGTRRGDAAAALPLLSGNWRRQGRLASLKANKRSRLPPRAPVRAEE